MFSDWNSDDHGGHEGDDRNVGIDSMGWSQALCEELRVVLCSRSQGETALKGESLWRVPHIHTVPLLLRAFTVTAFQRDRISCCVKMALEMSLNNRRCSSAERHYIEYCCVSIVFYQNSIQLYCRQWKCCAFSSKYVLVLFWLKVACFMMTFKCFDLVLFGCSNKP